MNDEQRFLISLTSDFINGRSCEYNSNVDIESLMKTAVTHNLFVIAYCALKNGAKNNAELSQKLRRYENRFLDTVFINNSQMQTFDELKSLLTRSEIRFVPFKGAVLRFLYPIPESRIMGDIDILIDRGSRDKVKKLLEINGYTCKNSNGPVWDYKKNGVLFEIHTNMLNGKAGATDEINKYFENAINDAEYSGYEGALPSQLHFEYLIAHAASHFTSYGAGTKHILDLAVMLKSYNIDCSCVISNLETAGLGRFAKELLTVCKRWYGFGTDYGYDTSKTEDLIANNGVFGNSDKGMSAVLIERNNMENGHFGKSFSQRFHLLFPSYKKMRTLPYIKFIDNRPYLTPIAWIYRLFYNLKHKNMRKNMVAKVKDIGDSVVRDKALQEYDYFKEIGLI